MAWLKNAAPKEFRVGDVLEHKESAQRGVITHVMGNIYVVECSSAPDTPFKKETRQVIKANAPDFWKKIGSVKLPPLFVQKDAELAKKKKTDAHLPAWCHHYESLKGLKVNLEKDASQWVVVEEYPNGEVDLLLSGDLGTHELIDPLRVPASKITPFATPLIQLGSVVTDDYYGLGKVVGTEGLEIDGTVDVIFHDRFRVRNYQLPEKVARKTSEEPPLVITKCATDGSYHAPFCHEHIEVLAVEEDKSRCAACEQGHHCGECGDTCFECRQMAEKAKKKGMPKKNSEEAKVHLQTLLSAIDVNAFTPNFYKAVESQLEAPEKGVVDIIHLGTPVVHAKTGREGIVIAANIKDWSVKVRWEDDQTESVYWRQELLKKSYEG